MSGSRGGRGGGGRGFGRGGGGRGHHYRFPQGDGERDDAGGVAGRGKRPWQGGAGRAAGGSPSRGRGRCGGRGWRGSGGGGGSGGYQHQPQQQQQQRYYHQPPHHRWGGGGGGGDRGGRIQEPRPPPQWQQPQPPPQPQPRAQQSRLPGRNALARFHRPWIRIGPSSGHHHSHHPSSQAGEEDGTPPFLLLSWNVLAASLVDRESYLGFATEEELDWGVRGPRVHEAVRRFDADVVCLQVRWGWVFVCNVGRYVLVYIKSL